MIQYQIKFYCKITKTSFVSTFTFLHHLEDSQKLKVLFTKITSEMPLTHDNFFGIIFKNFWHKSRFEIQALTMDTFQTN